MTFTLAWISSDSSPCSPGYVAPYRKVSQGNPHHRELPWRPKGNYRDSSGRSALAALSESGPSNGNMVRNRPGSDNASPAPCSTARRWQLVGLARVGEGLLGVTKGGIEARRLKQCQIVVVSRAKDKEENREGTISVWAISTGRRVAKFHKAKEVTNPIGPVESVGFSEDGKTVYYSAGRYRIMDVGT